MITISFEVNEEVNSWPEMFNVQNEGPSVKTDDATFVLDTVRKALCDYSQNEDVSPAKTFKEGLSKMRNDQERAYYIFAYGQMEARARSLSEQQQQSTGMDVLLELLIKSINPNVRI